MKVSRKFLHNFCKVRRKGNLLYLFPLVASGLFGLKLISEVSDSRITLDIPYNISTVHSSKIGIFTMFNDYSKYSDALNSVRCYAKSHNYSMVMVSDPETDPRIVENCGKYKILFFRKHCAASAILKDFDWLLVLDADTAVINSRKDLENWIEPEVILRWDILFNNCAIIYG